MFKNDEQTLKCEHEDGQKSSGHSQTSSLSLGNIMNKSKWSFDRLHSTDKYQQRSVLMFQS